ncbi:anti-sigma factor family protein [Azospirillum sp. ST 5-10]|uniref:anti-sigma factor family protein n=1 Tax=unclassified Azospirillum TaxID=2630922 RepID=UPI003F4A37B3
MAPNDDTPPGGPIGEADLHAWLDGELPPDRAAAVERHLAARPEDARRLESYRAQAALIGRAYAPLAAPPATLSTLPPVPRLRRRPPAWAAAAAAVLLFAAGLGAGWLARAALPAGGAMDPVVADALAAHLVYAAEVRHPVEVPADQEAHLVAWLSRRLGAPLAVPRLTGAGFTLLGGRLLPAEAGPAAQFMYEDAGGRRVTVYVRATPEGTDTAFRIAGEDGVTALYWKDRGLSWAVAGEVDRALLDDLAHRVYATFNS